MQFKRVIGVSIFLAKRLCSTMTIDKQFKILPASVIETFQNDGVVCLRNVFDKSEIQMVKEGIRDTFEAPSGYEDHLVEGDGSGMYFNDYCNWRKIRGLNRFVLHSSASCIAGQLMKSKRSVFFHEHVFIKTSKSSRPVPWHQDQPYYFVNGTQTCSLWMPVTPVKYGSLSFVRGSHTKKWYMPIKFGSLKEYSFDGKLDRHYESSDKIKPTKEDIISWDLEPGDCIAFNFSCLHGSSLAVNKQDRHVLSTRWVGEDVVYAKRPWECSPPAHLFEEQLEEGKELFKYKAFPTLWEDHMS